MELSSGARKGSQTYEIDVNSFHRFMGEEGSTCIVQCVSFSSGMGEENVRDRRQ